MDFRQALQVRDRPRIDRMPDVTDRQVLRDAADPFEFAEVDRDLVGRQQRIGDLGIVEHVDDRAVLRRVSLEMLHRPQAAGARHVHHDDRWRPGDVPADVARNQPRVDVVAAAGRIADHKAQRLALIKVVGAGGQRLAMRPPRVRASGCAWRSWQRPLVSEQSRFEDCCGSTPGATILEDGRVALQHACRGKPVLPELQRCARTKAASVWRCVEDRRSSREQSQWL